MIHILCLNPTVDRMYYIDDFLPGVQYHGNDTEAYPGGKGLNILRVLSGFITPLSFYAFTGGETGEIIKREAERLSDHSVFIETEGQTRTTINIMDRKNGRETEIKEKGPFITKGQLDELYKSLKENIHIDDIVILSGSLPDGVSPDTYLRVSEIAEEKGALVLLDTGEKQLKSSLPGNYYLIKPNENEIRGLFNDYTSPLSLLASKLQKLGAENVLITKGGDGAYFKGNGKEYEIKVPHIDVVSTIGSGDSTLAGFAYGLSLSLPPEESLALALAFGTANAKHREVGRVEKEEMEEIKNKIEIKEIKDHAI